MLHDAAAVLHDQRASGGDALRQLRGCGPDGKAHTSQKDRHKAKGHHRIAGVSEVRRAGAMIARARKLSVVSTSHAPPPTGADNTRDDGHIVKFLHHPFENELMLQIAGLEVDHRQPAFGRGTFTLQPLVQGQTIEAAVVARQGHADHRILTDKGRPAAKAGIEANRLKCAGVGIDMAKLPRAALDQPQLALMQLRHRQAVRDDLVIRKINQQTATRAVIAPAIGHVGFADAGGIAQHVPIQRQPVEVTAIFRRDLVNEIGLPQHLEAAPLGEGGNAVEPGDDEHRLPVTADMDIVNIDIASDMPGHRQIARVIALLCLTGLQKILKPPHLCACAHPDAAVGHCDTHAAVERTLENRQFAVRLKPDQKHLAGLIGGEHKARLHLRQPLREQPRAVHFKRGFYRLCHRSSYLLIMRSIFRNSGVCMPSHRRLCTFGRRCRLRTSEV